MTNVRWVHWRAAAWLALVLGAALLLLCYPDWRSADVWRETLQGWGPWVWPAAVAAQLVLALLMIPTLPMVAALALLLPAPMALALAMLGVLASAIAIYAAAHGAGLTQLAASVERAAPLRLWIARRGALALMLWCLAPFLPSDAGCYLAASARMPLHHYLGAVLAGELVLCSSVVFGIAAMQ
ncbi:MAG: VTT domain-containing protein [Rhodanobacteraceae bacterium]|nr:VTT domain-containing protein [Rhodanobacteraceae bacterium]